MKIKAILLILLVSSVSILFCSCASSEESLKRATAKEVGNTRLDDVTLYNVNRGATTVSWYAKTPSGCYECDADDMVRQVNCVKVKCDNKIINSQNSESAESKSNKPTSMDTSQKSKLQTVEMKDPSHAMLISALWPGLGQFYNGPTENTKGTIMAVGQGGLLLLTIIGALNPKEGSVGGSNYYNNTLSYNVKSPSINPLVWVGIIGMLGNSIYSMIDAGDRAKELNSEEGLSVRINVFNNLSQLIRTNTYNGFNANISLKINL